MLHQMPKRYNKSIEEKGAYSGDGLNIDSQLSNGKTAASSAFLSLKESSPEQSSFGKDYRTLSKLGLHA